MKKAVFASNEEWGLKELGIHGDEWIVYLQLIEFPGMIYPGETVAIVVNDISGEIVVI
jgi:hypothetical protein